MLAIHRRVLAALAARPDMPYCDTERARPFFAPMLAEVEGVERFVPDVHAFCERVRSSGFGVYFSPSIRAGRINNVAPFDLLVARPRFSAPVS
jgi:hypothetical protein